MSKIQLLYEKLMRIAYIFGAIFFVLSLVDFSIAMMMGAFDCSGGMCAVDESYPFFKVTLYPLIIATFVFIISGYIFFRMAHKESDLMSVADYKRALAEEQDQPTDGDFISREELYERLSHGNRKKPVIKKSIITRFKDKLADMNEKRDAAKQERQRRAEERALEDKAVLAEQQKQEAVHIEEEKASRARTKLNKTAIILQINKETELSQSDSRLFVNTLLDIIKETVIAEDEVKLAKFGSFAKVHIEEHTEVNPETEKETKIEAHNTVVFKAYKQLLESMNDDLVVEETQPEPVKEEVKAEPVKEEPKPEPVKEEVKAEPVKEEPKPEPVKEEVKVEPVKEEPKPEPVKEEVKIEPVKEEPKPEPVKEEVKAEPVKEEPKPEPVKEEVKTKPPKPKKVKPVTKTKTHFIEMMDETTELSKNKANKFLKFFAEVVKEQLALRNDVELEGIGFFTTIEMPAKEAVNPQTNEKIIVPAHHQVRLRFDEDLKDKMNEQN